MNSKTQKYRYLQSKNIFGFLFIFCCLIPWVSFGTNNMDSQVWPILSAVLFIISCIDVKFNINFIFLFFLPPIILVSSFFSVLNLDFILIRAFVSYFTFLLVLFGFLLYLKVYGFPIRTIVAVNIIYLLVGILQYAIDENLFQFLVQVRTTTNRGVTGLTPEPTYFGLFLFFISWLLLLGYKYRPTKPIKHLILVNLLAIVFLAQSPMILVFLLLSGLAIALYRFNIGTLLFAVVIGLSLGSIFGIFLEESRVYQIYRLWELNGLEIILVDASINVRVAHVFFSIYGWVLNDLMPGGFSSFQAMSSSLYAEYRDIFWYGAPSDRIMSFFGAFIYELGLLGFFYILLLITLCINFTFKRFLEITLLFIFLNSAIPVAFPLVAFVFALFIYRGNIPKIPSLQTNSDLSMKNI